MYFARVVNLIALATRFIRPALSPFVAPGEGILTASRPSTLAASRSPMALQK